MTPEILFLMGMITGAFLVVAVEPYLPPRPKRGIMAVLTVLTEIACALVLIGLLILGATTILRLPPGPREATPADVDAEVEAMFGPFPAPGPHEEPACLSSSS